MEGVILGLVGIALAIAIPLLVEYARRPALRIERGDDSNAEDYRIVHVKVINEPLKGPRGRWLLRNDATGCKVTMTFSSQSDRSTKTVEGRWSSTPEPLTRVSGRGFEFDITKSSQSLRFDLSPDEVGEPLGVAIKYDGDDEAYAFSWQSYAPYGEGLRNPVYLLRDTAYDVHVEAKAGEIAASARFLLTNDGDRRTGLSLSPVPRQLPG